MTAAIVSVLMPTFRQESWISRAIASLLAQSYENWELIVVNDGSGDALPEMLKAYDDSRLRYHEHDRNQGLGAALNRATELATGRYLAYLPSDDFWRRTHLEHCVRILDADPATDLVYGGVSWYPDGRFCGRQPVDAPHLRDDVAPGDETAVLTREAPSPGPGGLQSGNIFALVQVVHRRDAPGIRPWPTRRESVSDRLEMDMWLGMLRAGARVRYAGEVTCEWVDHPEQRHKIITGRGRSMEDWRDHGFGLSYYRQFYGVPSDERIRWEPSSRGIPVDEAVRYGSAPPARNAGSAGSGGMRIVIAGSLSHNPERIVALQEYGHRLHGLWMPRAHFWDTAGPLPFARVPEIPFDDAWRESVRALRPDVVYGLLNWNSVAFLYEVRRGLPEIPFVFHFKESPHLAMRAGYWDKLRYLVLNASAVLFSSREQREWFELTLGPAAIRSPVAVIDGDLPSAAVMGNVGDHRIGRPGEVHTVSVGRSLVEDPELLADAGIHLHIYSLFPDRKRPTDRYPESTYVHRHGPIEPSRWAAELSRYDAGWLHAFQSSNGGDLLAASWDDMNTPARLGTYAAAGLPWLVRDNTGHRVTVNRIGAELDCAIGYDSVAELADLLREEKRTRRSAEAMLAQRYQFAFDSHLDALTAIFRDATG